MATVNGDNGDNALNGTEDEDVINGFGGNDTIDSVDRPANIFAGSIAPRRDVVNAGGGNDVVTGGKLDQLDGGAGNDFLLVNFNFNGPVAGSAPPITLTLDASGTGTASDGTSITGFESLNFTLSDTGDNVVETGNVQAQLAGGNGNDTLTTGSADDGVFGGGGNDVISTGGGNDNIGGGSGDDVVTGGDGDDTFGVNLFTDGSDQVNLGAGNDTVRFDRFDGGAGNVRLTFTSAEVGNGNAFDSNTMANQDGGLAVRVQSEDSDGNLTGPVSRYDDEGTTFLAGTQGITFDVRDLVSGVQRGNTFEGVVLGTSGADALTFFPPFRGNQNFYYNAGMGDDVVVAGEANDFLVGGGGLDTLTGNGGDDSFIGGGGNDTLSGGAGNDSAIFNVSTDGADAVNLGDGSDVVTVNSTTPGQVRLSFTSAQVGNGNVNDSNNMANQDGGLAVRLQAEDGSDNLTGPVSRYDDEGITFVAGAGVTFDVRDLVSGVQRGNQFEVATLGTSGNDTLTAVQAARSYYFNAGMGDDTVTGGLANDFLVGGAGNDTLTDNVGNDSFIGGGGNDTITGGAGIDTAIFNVSTDGADAVNLGDGSDIVNVSAATPGQVRLSFTSAQVGNGNVNDSNNMANQDGGLAVRLQAEDGSDNLTGPVSRFDDEGITFVAAAGTTFDVRDLVSGVQRGNLFEVATLGTSGNDTLTAVQAARSYYFNAGMGDDTVTGGLANDFLVGGAGNDTLTDNVGNDSFIGGGGNDIITGGAGIDTAIFNVSTDGADSVNLGDGSDIVNVSAATPGQVRLSFTSAQVGNGNVNDSNNMANQDGGLAVRLQAEDGSDGLTGPVSRFDDEGITFVAAAGTTFDVRDLVSGVQRGNFFGVATLGTSGNDTLTAVQADRSYYFNAGMGDDTVTGGLANDFLVGGAGNDRFSGGAGDDQYIGGAGRDRFDYKMGDLTGDDTILDFMKVDLFTTDTMLRDDNRDGKIAFGANAVLDIGGGDTVTFTGIDPASGLRFLGQLGDGSFAYADAATRPIGATEGTLANNAFSGQGGAKTFFFDTALALDFGDDRITGFGTDDLLVTTTMIADGNRDGRIDFGDDRTLDLAGGTSVRIDNGAVQSLEFDGSVTQNGVDYFVYSRLGSTSTGTDDFMV